MYIEYVDEVQDMFHESLAIGSTILTLPIKYRAPSTPIARRVVRNAAAFCRSRTKYGSRNLYGRIGTYV